MKKYTKYGILILAKKYGISPLELAKMQFEQNFITTATPAGEITGLFYIMERMRIFGVPKAISSAMYVLRYVVSIGTNLIGMLVALVLMTFQGKLKNLNVLPLVAIVVMVILALIVFLLGAIALTRKVRFKNQGLNKKIIELRDAFELIQTDKKALLQSII